jgi:toxin CcdB
VVPLRPVARITNIVPRLNPVFRIRGRLYVMLTPQIAGTARTNLGRVAATLSQERDRIIAAIDMLVTGI